MVPVSRIVSSVVLLFLCIIVRIQLLPNSPIHILFSLLYSTFVALGLIFDILLFLRDYTCFPYSASGLIHRDMVGSGLC